MTELRHVLCVDDEEDILEVVQLCLELGAGLQVSRCASGREALARLPLIMPDLVLLDVMMPGLDGPSTLAEIRKSPGGAELPVVFMTARVQSEETAEYLRLGANAVIAKPFDPAALPAEIVRIWQNIAQDVQ